MSDIRMFFDVMEDNHIYFLYDDKVLVPTRQLEHSRNCILIELKEKAKKKKPIGELIQYIRNNKNERVGVMYSTLDSNNQITIGYSLCNTKYDKFDPKLGLTMAKERARKLNRKFPKQFEFPQSISKNIKQFIERSLRYFKTEQVITVTDHA